MRDSRDGIITSHVGSLPRPDELIVANRARDQGTAGDEAAFQKLLQSSVSDIVKRQLNVGIAVPNDGEFGKSMGQHVNYRAWLSYIFHRLDGIEVSARARTSLSPSICRTGEIARDSSGLIPTPISPFRLVRNGRRNPCVPAR
jgi:methionine synthase II (cobalamin-independent)